jgi:antitoxin component YwqK of YwqJK toxin-antitoxin module
MNEPIDVEREYWKKHLFGGKGNLKSEYQLKNGKREGSGTLFWKSGTKELDSNWKNGKRGK